MSEQILSEYASPCKAQCGMQCHSLETAADLIVDPQAFIEFCGTVAGCALTYSLPALEQLRSDRREEAQDA